LTSYVTGANDKTYTEYMIEFENVNNKAVVDITLRPRCAIAPFSRNSIYLLNLSPMNGTLTSPFYVHASMSLVYLFLANVHRHHSNNSYTATCFSVILPIGLNRQIFMFLS